jgi:predicted nuclease of predicted toxin-antitoxin system
LKLLFDQNLSPRLTLTLSSEFPESRHVREAGLASASDNEVWNYAKQFDFAIVSKDTDFSQRSFLLGFPPKVIWVRLGNCTTAQIANTLRAYETAIQHFELDHESSFLVIDPLPEIALDKKSQADQFSQTPRSTTLAAIHYDPALEVLEVELQTTGEIYRYFGVPAAEYEGLLKEPSKTAYLNSRIKGRYRFQKVL